MIRGGIVPGDILITPKTHEAYVYLGYYIGRPNKCGYFYRWPSEGYLYMFINNCTFKMPNISKESICENIYTRSYDILAGNGAYTKNYKIFESKVGHVDIMNEPTVQRVIQNLYGLTRVGDKKPRKS